MSLRGRGAVAIWHDLLPEARDEFLQWHAREHMPERVAIPGFLRGRRYARLQGDRAYFNLYEADTPQTLAGRAYLDRLNNPTAWTRAVVASFRQVARSTCSVLASVGIGDGGVVQTLRLEDLSDAARDLVGATLPEIAAAPGVSAAHLLEADEATSRIETREREARLGATEVPRHVVLIEGVSQAAVEAAGRALLEALRPAQPGGVTAASYVLEHATEAQAAAA